MDSITVRDLDDQVLRLLEQRASSNNRSLESEVHAILGESVQRDTFVGDWLALAESVRVDLDLPVRSMPRELDW
jgi:plasmid stability protein